MNENNVFGCRRHDCAMALTSSGAYRCSSCGRQIVREGVVLMDSACPALYNALETIDYDTIQGVSEEASRGVGAKWWQLIGEVSPFEVPRRVLEVGAGTGLLTRGLALQNPDWNYVACDASMQFLTANSALFPLTSNQPTWLRSSFQDLPFRSGLFNAVLGNSVLHHVYDWRTTLREFRRVLSKHGFLILGEPVLEGTVFIGLLARLIVELSDRCERLSLSEAERKALLNIGVMSTREFWKQVAEQNRDTWDDKHLFEIAELTEAAREAGFSSTEVRGWKPIDDGYRVEFVAALRIFGIDPKLSDRFECVFSTVQEAFVEQSPWKLPTAFSHIIMSA